MKMNLRNFVKQKAVLFLKWTRVLLSLCFAILVVIIKYCPGKTVLLGCNTDSLHLFVFYIDMFKGSLQ